MFDSAGPEGKVRGTPQQVIEKYQSLARDAQLSSDRVAAENFLQHAEHYVRMLAEANAQLEAQNAARREQQEREAEARAAEAAKRGEDETAAPAEEARTEAASDLVDTPEEQQQPKRPRQRSRRNGPKKVEAEGADEQPAAQPAAE
ncbi:sRNA-binding protein [Rubricella aquisinus]|uniref:SRNA-binding protein n=1 Tax=Rubricella aquisinus TaxID=2028108 RepID=A0A840WZ32_9RHOB|nr:sRNA-binding protein [Rubricella aquisinus]